MADGSPSKTPLRGRARFLASSPQSRHKLRSSSAASPAQSSDAATYVRIPRSPQKEATSRQRSASKEAPLKGKVAKLYASTRAASSRRLSSSQSGAAPSLAAASQRSQRAPVPSTAEVSRPVKSPRRVLRSTPPRQPVADEVGVTAEAEAGVKRKRGSAAPVKQRTAGEPKVYGSGMGNAKGHKKTCSSCGALGHNRRWCHKYSNGKVKDSTKDTSNTTRTTKCGLCHMVGHTRAQCPQAPVYEDDDSSDEEDKKQAPASSKVQSVDAGGESSEDEEDGDYDIWDENPADPRHDETTRTGVFVVHEHGLRPKGVQETGHAPVYDGERVEYVQARANAYTSVWRQIEREAFRILRDSTVHTFQEMNSFLHEAARPASMVTESSMAAPQLSVGVLVSADSASDRSVVLEHLKENIMSSDGDTLPLFQGTLDSLRRARGPNATAAAAAARESKSVAKQSVAEEDEQSLCVIVRARECTRVEAAVSAITRKFVNLAAPSSSRGVGRGRQLRRRTGLMDIYRASWNETTVTRQRRGVSSLVRKYPHLAHSLLQPLLEWYDEVILPDSDSDSDSDSQSDDEEAKDDDDEEKDQGHTKRRKTSHSVAGTAGARGDGDGSAVVAAPALESQKQDSQKRLSRRRLVVVFEGLEEFDVGVLNSVTELFASHMKFAPFAFVWSVMTPTHVHSSLLEPVATSLRMRTFFMQPSLPCLQRILDSVFVKGVIEPAADSSAAADPIHAEQKGLCSVQLSSEVIDQLFDHFTSNSFSVQNFLHGVRFALARHFAQVGCSHMAMVSAATDDLWDVEDTDEADAMRDGEDNGDETDQKMMGINEVSGLRHSVKLSSADAQFIRSLPSVKKALADATEVKRQQLLSSTAALQTQVVRWLSHCRRHRLVFGKHLELFMATVRHLSVRITFDSLRSGSKLSDFVAAAAAHAGAASGSAQSSAAPAAAPADASTFLVAEQTLCYFALMSKPLAAIPALYRVLSAIDSLPTDGLKQLVQLWQSIGPSVGLTTADMGRLNSVLEGLSVRRLSTKASDKRVVNAKQRRQTIVEQATAHFQDDATARAAVVSFFQDFCDTRLAPLTVLPLHELVLCTGRGAGDTPTLPSLTSVLQPRVRATVSSALSQPEAYLSGGGAASAAAAVSSVQATEDICIIYRVFMEGGKLVNLYDWFKAYCAASSSNAESEQQKLARFTQATTELRFLGLLKPSTRKLDHVQKLSFVYT